MMPVASELAGLVDMFCEGDLAPQQAARLEALVADSSEARQYLLDCFQVHCELAWDLGRESEDLGQPDSTRHGPISLQFRARTETTPWLEVRRDGGRFARCDHAGAERPLPWWNPSDRVPSCKRRADWAGEGRAMER